MANGRLRSTADVLSRVYPQAVAGTRFVFLPRIPTSSTWPMSKSPPSVGRRSIFVPTQVHYRHGYCAGTSGGSTTSDRGSDLLRVRNDRKGSR